jgi:P-type Mg2+ transporter
MTSDTGPERKFWQISLADLERQLGAGRNGLSSAEAAARRLRYGPNTLGERRRLSLPLKFLSRFRNPLVIILLAAAMISAFTGDLTAFIIISTIVLMSAVLDTVQEFRAELAAEHLKVSVTLARGAIRMSKAQVIVKRLGAIHDLGSMDVLCTDKTGTLTEAKIRLARQVALSGADSERVLDLAWLNSHFQAGLRNPLDTAIVESGPSRGEGWAKIDVVPFDFQRRRVSVLLEHEGRRLLITKGAPEDVIKLASRYEEPGKPELMPLDDSARTGAAKVFEGLSAEGFRALGVAWRELEPDRAGATVADERDLVFAGFVVFFDPPKASAAAAITALGAKGVGVKILSGDNERVTQHVCAELGIPITGVMTGTEIEALSEEALGARLEETNLFCRVAPAQKNRIILGLRHRGHVVGFLGDGINDAPSLHSSDVGISVDSAVDVAKDAADIILLQQDLGVLERGVTEGRRAFANIMKYIMMAMSSNFGNMFSMAGATLILPFLPMLPVQILLNNLLYDVSEMPIALDEVDREITEKPEHWDMRFIRNFMLLLGPVSSVFDFLTFGLLLLVFHADEALFQTGWFIESLATQVLVIFVLRTRRNPLRSHPHPLLATTSVAVVVLAVVLPFTPLGAWFGFVPPSAAFLFAIAGLTVSYLLLAQGAKWAFYRLWSPAGAVPAPLIRAPLPLIGRS